MKKTLKTYFIITLGTFLIAIGVYFFEFANNFSTGGASGISIVLAKVWGVISPAKIVTVINLFLLILGFLVFGKKFAAKTIYSTLLLSFLLNLFEGIFPMAKPFTDQKLLELFFDMILVALGSALIFNEEASSGGTDILAMILKKFTNLDIGKALMTVDFFVVLAALAVFGVETGMFSIFAILIRTLVVDNAMESLNTSKFFLIITDQCEEILRFITNDLERGATFSKYFQGAFTGEDKTMILVVVDRRQAVRLKHKIKDIDPKAFTVISTTSDIIGDGFKMA